MARSVQGDNESKPLCLWETSRLSVNISAQKVSLSTCEQLALPDESHWSSRAPTKFLLDLSSAKGSEGEKVACV